MVAKLVDIENMRNETIGLGSMEVKSLFNNNYSIMPKINKFVDYLLLKSNRRCEFTAGSSKPVPLTANPVLTDLNNSDSFESR
ncbi:hypothetical protein R6Q57_003492 [Mikania cordata]